MRPEFFLKCDNEVSWILAEYIFYDGFVFEEIERAC